MRDSCLHRIVPARPLPVFRCAGLTCCHGESMIGTARVLSCAAMLKGPGRNGKTKDRTVAATATGLARGRRVTGKAPGR